MIAVYNESDIISEILDYYLSQDISLVIVDNGSTDGSYEILQEYANKELIKLYQFKSDTFRFTILERILYDMAIAEHPDWVILIGADEFIESGLSSITLKEVINQIDAEGYNLIQLDEFDFFMTSVDDKQEKSVKKRLQYYSYHGDYQYRAWKYRPGITVEISGGHYPIFPQEYNYRVAPRKLVLRHYPFRSIEQAEKKLSERLAKSTGTVDEKVGYGIHYRYIKESTASLVQDYNKLARYEENGQWSYQYKLVPFNPFGVNAPRRSELFTSDGKLKIAEQNITDFLYKIQRLEDQMNEMKHHPLGGLIWIYHNRSDLQKIYPEVKIGDYDRFIQWALNNSSNEILKSFIQWYKQQNFQKITDEMKTHPLGALMLVYHRRPDLQEAYPEVKHGNYKRLIEWAANDKNNVMLTPFRSWYSNHLGSKNLQL